MRRELRNCSRNFRRKCSPQNKNVRLRALMQALTPDTLLPEAGSLLHKAIDSRLTAEQRQGWNEFEQRRRQFLRQADVQRQILLCSQRATLTVAQWDAFAELLNALAACARRRSGENLAETRSK